MSERIQGLPKAIAGKYFLSGILWLVPIAAAGLCVWFLLRDYVFAGPTITIYFQDGEGLQAENSTVKYRDINIGQIESVKLTKDCGHVAVRAKLEHFAADIARQGSIFWIVRPELKLGEVSGLRTIVSGNYVTVQPGSGERTNIFTGVESEPIPPIPSIGITLLTDDLGSLESESPIFYRGLQVGEVTDYRLTGDGRNVEIRARIRQPYVPLVRANSKFWNAGGINAHVGLFSGLQISAESLQTVIIGGVAFATPPDYGPEATNGTVFALNAKEEDSWKDWAPAIALGTPPFVESTKNNLPPLNTTR